MKLSILSTLIKLTLSTLLIINFSCSKTETGDEHCPEGYTGKNCDLQITPDSVFVTKINIIRFPAANIPGHNWDTTSDADIFVQVRQNNVEIWRSTKVFANASPDTNYIFKTDTLVLTDQMAQYAIHLYDKDDSSDEYMGGINFLSYTYNNGFPELLIIDDGSEVAAELSLEYAWK